MFTEYVEAAVWHARYQQIEDGTFFGEIPGSQGLWADAETEVACRTEPRGVLEDWILLHVADYTPLPQAAGLMPTLGPIMRQSVSIACATSVSQTRAALGSGRVGGP